MRSIALCLFAALALVLSGSADAQWTSPTTAQIAWQAPPGCDFVRVETALGPLGVFPAAQGGVVLGPAGSQDAVWTPEPYQQYLVTFLPASHPGPDVVVTLPHRPPTPRAWLPWVAQQRPG